MKKIRRDEDARLLVPKNYSFVGEPYRHQIITFIYGLFHHNLAILSTMGTGKAQPIGSKVLTPIGYSNIEDLIKGSVVTDPRGGTTTVEDIFKRGKQETYKISFSDGTSTLCSKDHLWRVHSASNKFANPSKSIFSIGKILTTNEIFQTGTKDTFGNSKYFIPVVNPVEFNGELPKFPYILSLSEVGKLLNFSTTTIWKWRKKNILSPDIPWSKHKAFYSLPLIISFAEEKKYHISINKKDLWYSLHPYLLGLLLGDGGLSKGDGVTFTSADKEVICNLKKVLPKNHKLSSYSEITYGIVTKQQANLVLYAIKSLGLLGKLSYEKFIPKEYLLSSTPNRLELLQGLLDTDGFIDKRGMISFSSSSLRLVEDVIFLVRSLGGEAREPRIKKTKCRLHYLTSIKLPLGVSPFKLSRKLNRISKNRKYLPFRAITNIEYVGKKPSLCIRVSSKDGLYVTNDFIVTHNTYCAISLARYWIQQGEAKRILVVCPSSVLFNWKDEVEKFSEYDAHVLHSGKAISREGRIKLFSIPSTFYIINYEATLHYLKYILRLESDIVIFDESSRVANPKAQQTRACAKIASQTKYRYILNGTPIPNRPEGLWSQFYMLDFGETLGPTYKIFKQCYFTTIKARSKAGKFFSIVKPKSTWHLAEVAKLVARKSVRYTKEECAPFLPKKNYQVRELTLPKESRKLYKEVFENAKLEIEQLGQNVSAHIVLTKFIKASQVSSGYLKTDEGNFLRLKSNPKLKELKHLIEEILYDDAITIWCKYRFSISIIEEMLQQMGVRYEVITGDVQNKSAVAKKFQTTSIQELPVMLCQIRAGGIGLNLHKASFSIFYENEWRLLDRQQAEDRLHRIGQEKSVTVIDLVVKDSIDELVLKAVRNNKEIADFILERIE